MNKILKLLSLASVAITPIALAVSCGSTNKEDIKIEIYSKAVRLTSYEEQINKYNDNLDEKDKLDILNKLFEGVKVDNLNNFTVDVEIGQPELSKPMSIKLSANKGYSFAKSNGDAAKSIHSKVHLDITAKSSYTKEVFDVAYEALIASNEQTDKIKAISSIFDFTQFELDKNIETSFKIESKEDVDRKYISLIVVNEWYDFGSTGNISQLFVPWINADIKAIPTFIHDFEAWILKNSDWANINDENKLKEIQVLFDGVTAEYLELFKVNIDSENKVVTLTAKQNFSFKTGAIDGVLSSIKNSVIKITPTPVKQATILIFERQWDETNALDLKLADLSLLFEGVNLSNIDLFTVKIIDASGVKKVYLEPKVNYIFEGEGVDANGHLYAITN